jgi:hypothetical protein
VKKEAGMHAALQFMVYLHALLMLTGRGILQTAVSFKESKEGNKHGNCKELRWPT